MLTRGAEAVPRPGRGGSGGHQSRPAGCCRQEEISGISESAGGPAGRPSWVDCSRFSRFWLGVAGAGRRRSGQRRGLRFPLLRKICGMLAGDFTEGVRAKLVDKDDRPRWRHARIEDVTPADVDALFSA